jgi:hypothetical protein
MTAARRVFKNLRLFESTPASLAAVTAAIIFFLVTRAGYINARVGAASLSFTWLAYAFGAICLVFSLGFIFLYARNLKVLGFGAVMCALIYWGLNSLDPVLIAYRLSQSKYESAIAASRTPDPKFVVFKLSEGYGFPAGGAWEYIVFDATDEIGLPADERTKAWEALHGSYVAPLNYQCTVTIRHLEAHFFYLLHRC